MSVTKKLKAFFQQDTAPGIVLIFTAFAALVVANSSLAGHYLHFLELPVQFRIGALDIEKNMLLLINDGLMAIFFLLIGLEVKRELVEGSLKTKKQAIFPVVAAIGGMVVPVLIFTVFNHGDSIAMTGWAIPSATDIAFTLGVLALFGKRVPVCLKIFLLALAVIDDLGAVLIIALFFSSDLSITALVVAAAACLILYYMNKHEVHRLTAYLLVGAILWIAVLKSGVHATVAGVILGFLIPLGTTDKRSPLRNLEHGISPWSNFLILPLFAFANSGVPLGGLDAGTLLQPLPLGIALGLIIGKPIGVTGACWLSHKLGIAKLPDEINFGHILGASILCGIGFTMSIFIATLAFPSNVGPELINTSRIAIFIGSFASAIIGYMVLKYVFERYPTEVKRHKKPDVDNQTESEKVAEANATN